MTRTEIHQNGLEGSAEIAEEELKAVFKLIVKYPEKFTLEDCIKCTENFAKVIDSFLNIT